MGFKAASRSKIFRFLDPGLLRDGELELVLVARQPAIQLKAYVPAYKFEMTVRGCKAGVIDLRIGTAAEMVRDGGQIGYGVDPAHRGHRLAARSVRLLRGLAARHGIDPLLITCDPDNIASRRTCELAGAVYVETTAHKCRFRLVYNRQGHKVGTSPTDAPVRFLT